MTQFRSNKKKYLNTIRSVFKDKKSEEKKDKNRKSISFIVECLLKSSTKVAL